MGDFKKMMGKYEETFNLRRDKTSLVLTARGVFDEQASIIRNDIDLSPQGKEKKLEALKTEVGEGLLKTFGEKIGEHKKAVVAASVEAEKILNKPHLAPHSDKLKSFEREYDKLKVDLMLGTRPQDSVKALREFISKQDDPYFTDVIVKEFPGLISSVLDTAGPEKDSYKIEMRGLLNIARENGITEEKRKAADVHESLKDAFTQKPFLEKDMVLDNVSAIFGNKIARYANDPEAYFRIESSQEDGDE
ncbi:hypothetical protein Q9251_08195 [Alkalihalobacillus macyae]|uniref:hypothetical protein n=1 Tax=Guptibacillus hwajinpoensis TaxID=208199 RepID=UPI00273B0CF1|nr:hypothetical protein [Alkalihalobacillus macyae]MDP4550863.1 hypothetical protein [Alkalihalobacillus macyae]